MKLAFTKVTYSELEAFIQYLSFCKVFEDPDPAVQTMGRKLLMKAYLRLGNRHIQAQVKDTFTVHFTREEAQIICRYIGWRGATGHTYTDQVVHYYYLQLHQFTA